MALRGKRQEYLSCSESDLTYNTLRERWNGWNPKRTHLNTGQCEKPFQLQTPKDDTVTIYIKTRRQDKIMSPRLSSLSNLYLLVDFTPRIKTEMVSVITPRAILYPKILMSSWRYHQRSCASGDHLCEWWQTVCTLSEVGFAARGYQQAIFPRLLIAPCLAKRNMSVSTDTQVVQETWHVCVVKILKIGFVSSD